MNDYWSQYDPNDPVRKKLMAMTGTSQDPLSTMRRTAGIEGLPGQTAPVPPSFMSRMGDHLKSPLGMIGAGVQLATTDFDDPKSIGGTVGGIAGQAAGASLGSQMATLGAAGGPIGAAIGGLLGTVGGSALGGLFGDDKEEEARKEAKRQALFEQLRNNMLASGQYLQQRARGIAGV